MASHADIPIDELLDAAIDYLNDGVPLPRVAEAFGWTEEQLHKAFVAWSVPLRPEDTKRPSSRKVIPSRFVPPAPKTHESQSAYDQRMARAWVAWRLQDMPELGQGLTPLGPRKPSGMPHHDDTVAGMSRKHRQLGLMARRRTRVAGGRTSALLNDMRAAGLLPSRGVGVNRAGRYWT